MLPPERPRGEARRDQTDQEQPADASQWLRRGLAQRPEIFEVSCGKIIELFDGCSAERPYAGCLGAVEW